MKIDRNLMNEYLIHEFLRGNIKGYKAYHNGEWYFKLEDNALYGGPILRLRNDMGSTIVHLTDNDECVEDAAKQIQETLYDLEDMIEREKNISEYCRKNPWTYSGT